jgi:hypothetical protein
MTQDYFKQRRAYMKRIGMCVDCQQRAASRPHVCCEACLEARRRRSKDAYWRIKLTTQLYNSGGRWLPCS